MEWIFLWVEEGNFFEAPYFFSCYFALTNTNMILKLESLATFLFRILHQRCFEVPQDSISRITLPWDNHDCFFRKHSLHIYKVLLLASQVDSKLLSPRSGIDVAASWNAAYEQCYQMRCEKYTFAKMYRQINIFQLLSFF